MDTSAAKFLSIVVPVYNEQENVGELVGEIGAALGGAGLAYELVVVDDGSTDGTLAALRGLQGEHPELRVIRFRRNFGQTAALAAGFDHARGDVVVPLDGDLQNDPRDIVRLVKKLEEGYDVVSGWRRDRKDKLVTRKLPSWVANWLIGRITGVRLHDYGCTLKAYRREALENVNLYGEMHRFIPAVAKWSGAEVAEMAVNHRPRVRGKAKYGLSRTFKVVLDLVTVKFLGTFSTKPLHIFGGIGLLTVLAGMLSGLVVVYQKWFAEPQLPMNRNPLLVLTAMLMMMSVQFLLMGLLAEMLCRTYHESQNKATYVVRAIYESAVQEQGQGGGHVQV